MSNLLLAIALVTFSIFVHELGHFLVARWRKLITPRFSLFGIGPPIIARKWRGVEYCICWLPIGAYVMIPQLTDMDMGELEGEVPADVPHLPPADYKSKVMVAIAGPAANILFAFLLSCIVWIVGVRVSAEFNRTEVGEVVQQLENSDGQKVTGPAAAAGIQPGDIIRQVDGKPVANFQDIMMGVILGSQSSPDGRRSVTLTLERDGKTLTRTVYPELTGNDGIRNIGIGPHSDLVVDKVNADSAAAKAGLLPGDRITAVNGTVLESREALREHFQKTHAEPSILTYKRGDQTLTAQLQPRLEKVNGQEYYLIGVTWRIPTVLVNKTPFEQFSEAYEQIYQTFASLLNRKSDIGVRHMSGIVGIVDNLQQAASAGLVPTLGFLIVINISLATFNLLPIPVLDGGHVFFATLAKLRGRAFNTVWMQNIVTACFIMLVGLIFYVSYHDIRRVVLNYTEEKAAAAPATPPEKGKGAPAPAKP